MAKVSLAKLALKLDTSTKEVHWNGETIEVLQYLPVKQKIDLITNTINSSTVEDVNYYNPITLSVLEQLNLVFYYTNINFTDKQKEDLMGLFDKLSSSGLMQEIFAAIPDEEIDTIHEYLESTVGAIYEYNQSALGILDSLHQDYDNLNFDINKLQNEISNPENATLLKEIMTRLG